MYKTYFKQALALIMQNPFISIVSIAGTALAIMMVMTMIVVQEIKSSAIKPESKSDRMLFVDYQVLVRNEKSRSSGNLDLDHGKALYDLPTPEAVSLFGGAGRSAVSRPGSSESFHGGVRPTDAAYWKLFDFEWVAGKPYGEEEVDAGVNEAVMAEGFAREIFGSQDPVGQILTIDFQDYRVVGVVKDVAPLFNSASSKIWVPYTTTEVRSPNAALLARDKKDFPAITEEVREYERRFAVENEPSTIWFRGPQTKSEKAAGVYGLDLEDYEKQINTRRSIRFLTIAVLLLIPAVNLAGFSLARMRKRTAEIGIRKAFGARSNVILIQVLYENLITSLIGGFAGLALCYAVIYSFRHWLLGIPAGSPVPFSTMISIPVFLAVFLLCIVLNLLSAGIPAYRAARMSIVNSLNRNEQQRW